MKFTVGQKLWLVPKYPRNMGRMLGDRLIVVTTIGSRWVYFTEEGMHCHPCRFDAKTMSVDPLCKYGYDGHVYMSEAAYWEHMTTKNMWEYTTSRIDRHNYPPSMTAHKIDEMCQQLGIPLFPRGGTVS